MIEDEDCATSPLKERNGASANLPTLDEIKEGILSSNVDANFQMTQAARKMLSKERNPPIDSMIESGLVPKMVEFLKVHSHPALQFEAAWALTNIASGTSEQTRTVVRSGAVPFLVQLLSSEDDNVCEQAVWALGNIAGDGPTLRDEVIKAGILKPLLALVVSQNVAPPFLSNITWTISNLCRNKNPSPPIVVAHTCLPVLTKLVQHTDKQIVSKCSCFLNSVRAPFTGI